MQRNQFLKYILPINSVLLLALAACGPGPAPLPTVPPSPMPTVLPSPSPTVPPSPTATVLPSPAPTAEATCPEPAEGTQLLRNEALGYCLLFPADYIRVDPLPYEVCLVPGEPYLLCHNAVAFFNVEDAAGRSLSQWADEYAARYGIIDEPSSQTIAGEEAILFPEVVWQASVRVVLLLHDARLYMLAFGLPDAADPASVERFDRLYNTVIESFTFLPVPPPPQLAEAGEGARGSAVVVYAKDGDIIVWDETTGESQVIIDSGDVIQVALSDDGQLVAFVRTLPSEAGGSGHQESAVWVVERNGDDPRQLVSTDELRARLGASLTDSTSILCLEWIPNSHRLLYSGSISPPFEGERCYPVGTKVLYLVDVETLAGAELVLPEGGEETFSPSPDGEYIAVGTQRGVSFVSVDDSLSGEVVFTPSGGGMSGRGPFTLRAWTQDSRAVLVRGSLVNEGNFTTRFTIWRVPVDGTPAQPLITFRGDRDQLAPDGSVVSFVRGIGPGGVSERFFAPLHEDLGPLAVIPDPFGLSWSPGGSAYNLGWEAMSPLCPSAAQAVEVCEPAIAFGERVGSLEWLDRNRFLYVTSVPRRLIFGWLDGSATLIADDPPDPLSLAAVASTCRDDAEFFSDVTVPDGTHFAPNRFFQKTWRVRNTGDCAWDDSYRLTFLFGDRLSGPRSAPLSATVQPGEEVDLSVMLIAPESPGTYQGQWQLFAPEGTPFGTAPYVVIQVP